jgi:hypothetical protein
LFLMAKPSKHLVTAGWEPTAELIAIAVTPHDPFVPQLPGMAM